MIRKKKVIKLNFMNNVDLKTAYIAQLDQPHELRMGVGPNTFLDIQNNIITLSGGTPSQFNIQGLNLMFAGMIQTSTFPFSLIPSTIATPNPAQSIKPPFLDLIPVIQQISIAASLIATRV